jgi:hypothetical protein
MTVRVEDLSSEVIPETETQGPVAMEPGLPAFELEERFRAVRERLARDAERTRAEGYGD